MSKIKLLSRVNVVLNCCIQINVIFSRNRKTMSTRTGSLKKNILFDDSKIIINK